MLTLCLILSASAVLASENISLTLPGTYKINDTGENVVGNISIDPENESFKITLNNSKVIDSKMLNTANNGYGYWIWSSDMYDADLKNLSDQGVKYIFLNSFAFTEYGQRDVLEWIQTANSYGIEVHVWMQIFYNDEWISPVDKNGSFNTAYFNQKIEEARYYAGLDGVSGIQLDYLRFEGTASEYKNSTEAINYFVKSCSEEVKKVNPDITLSATVMPEKETTTYYYGQDIPTISKYVDVIVPMIYKGNYNQNEEWIKDTTEWFVDNSDAEVWCGLQSYRSDDNLTQLSASEINNDSKACIDGGADSVILFKWGMNNNTDKKGLEYI